MTDLLKPGEVARRLQVSRTWLYAAAKSGRIPSVRLGGADGPVRFVEEDVEGGSSAPERRGARGRAVPRRYGGPAAPPSTCFGPDALISGPPAAAATP